jgi:RNA polymerase sigma-70 factor (ECF subfamily)
VGDGGAEARRLLLHRYCGAAYRYLRAALGDEDAALDSLQEFVLRFLRGDFRRADPGSGRFRDYLKAALINLVADYHRERRALPVPLPIDIDERTIAPESGSDNEVSFLRGWREELIDRAWTALAEANATYHEVLVSHVENPDLTSAEAADRLGARLAKSFTAAHVRVTLQRAREKFAELLLDEVAHSLGACTEAELVLELRTMRLSRLCATALTKRQRRSNA